MQKGKGRQSSAEPPGLERSVQVNEIPVPVRLTEEWEETKRQLQTTRAQLKVREEMLQQRDQQIRDLVEELIFLEQKIRQQVSQVLHDELQQLLFAAQVQVQFVKQALTSDQTETLLGDVKQIKTMLDEALRITRRLALDFAPSLSQSEDTKANDAGTGRAYE